MFSLVEDSLDRGCPSCLDAEFWINSESLSPKTVVKPLATGVVGLLDWLEPKLDSTSCGVGVTPCPELDDMSVWGVDVTTCPEFGVPAITSLTPLGGGVTSKRPPCPSPRVGVS